MFVDIIKYDVEVATGFTQFANCFAKVILDDAVIAKCREVALRVLRQLLVPDHVMHFSRGVRARFGTVLLVRHGQTTPWNTRNRNQAQRCAWP